jgi:molybdate transport system permease protein
MRSRAPASIAVLSGLGAAFVVVPLLVLSGRVPWERVGDVAADPAVRSALGISLVASVGSLALASVLGLPLAWLLARVELRWKRLLRAVVTLPMVVPPVVAGVGLLATFGRRGLIGQPLASVSGVSIPFSIVAVILAGAFVSMPFLVVTVEAGIRSMDGRFEEAAATLGASRWYVLRRVTVPLVSPSLSAGLALSWARALGEFGATITFAGNVPGRTQTMPLAVFVQLERDPGAAYLLSLVLVIISLVVLVVTRRRLDPL